VPCHATTPHGLIPPPIKRARTGKLRRGYCNLGKFYCINVNTVILGRGGSRRKLPVSPTSSDQQKVLPREIHSLARLLTNSKMI
jgi:hypothetical protein